MTILDEAALARLREPFSPDKVSWRVGSTTKDKTRGMALAYIDARDVMERLDLVCGPTGWQVEYVPMANGTTCARIGIRAGDEWVWKSNGAGATDVEPEKGAYSDALKRAAVMWGIGRYLYDLPSPWVGLNEQRQIAESEMPRLRALLGGTKPKSAYQARKDGDWKSLAEGLKECSTADMVDEYLRANADMLAKMPETWRTHWDDLVAKQRDGARARAA